jgi:hypothetical protein
VTNKKVYCIHTAYFDGLTRSFLKADIDDAGLIGEWSVTSDLLPVGRSETLNVFVAKGYVYLLGGDTVAGAGLYSRDCYSAPISRDGTVGTFTLASSQLPLANKLNVPFVIIGDRVYLMAGYTKSVEYDSDIYTAAILPGGQLGTWSKLGEMPFLRIGVGSLVTKKELYLPGGWEGLALPVRGNICGINDSGQLVGWDRLPESSPPISASAMFFATKNHFYAVDGVIHVADTEGGLNDYSPYYTA